MFVISSTLIIEPWQCKRGRESNILIIIKTKRSGKEKNDDNVMPFGTNHGNIIQIDVRGLASLGISYFLASKNSPVSS